jgi:transmembrane sensor
MGDRKTAQDTCNQKMGPDILNASTSARGLEKQAFEKLLMTLSADGTRADIEEFSIWRQQSPDHERAYRKAAALYYAVGLAAKDFTGESKQRRAAQFNSRRAFLMGASSSAIAAGVAALALHPPLGLWRPLTDHFADHATRIGERRMVQLPDGVALHMNTRTQVNTPEGPTRTVVMKQGEVAVTCPSPTQITVIADRGSVFSDGGMFAVRYVGDGVAVTCAEGKARVAVGKEIAELLAGEQTVYTADGLSAPVRIDAANQLAWRSGFLVFQGDLLSAAVREINRYRRAPIIIANDDLAARRLTARFDIDQLDNVIAYFERAFGVRPLELPGGVVVLL